MYLLRSMTYKHITILVSLQSLLLFQATIESQLRNAVQTQLDGVQKGLQTFQELEKIVRDVRGSMNDVGTLYQDCGELMDVVKPIKELNKKHQQVWVMAPSKKIIVMDFFTTAQDYHNSPPQYFQRAHCCQGDT